MGRRRCCCGCRICSDDFNRANSSSILPFIEHTGNWSIDSARLKEAGNSNAIAYCPTKHFYRTKSGVVWATVKSLQIGDRPIVFLNYHPGASSPTEYVKLYPAGSPNKCGVELVSGGYSSAWSPGFDYNPGDDFVMKICRSNEGVYGGVTSVSKNLYLCVEAESSPEPGYAGVANHGTSALYFDDFVFEQHYITNPHCENCGCECDGNCLGRFLTLTIVSDNPNRDGTEIQLELDDTLDPLWEWYGAADVPNCSGSGSTENQFRFICKDEAASRGCDPGEYILTGVGFQGNCTTTDWTGTACGTTYECDPLDIRFGPFTCSFSGGSPPSCTETLIITES